MGQENKDKPAEAPPPTRWQVWQARLKAVPGAGLAFFLIPLCLIGYFGWYYWGAEHLDIALYSLQQENIELTPQPSWIRCNVRDDVYRHGALSQVSLQDPQASATIAHAFDVHPCVKSTTRVRKLGGGKVQVDVQYRMPAAMVYYERKVPGVPGETKKGCFPVDSEGVVLPTTEFTREQVYDYFQIYAPGAAPAGDVGMPFGDMRIIQALDLCKLLTPMRVDWKLEEIYVDPDSVAGGPSPWVLRIVTKDKRQIIWGHAPGKEIVGEPRFETKITSMERWLRAPVPMSNANSPQTTLDLRAATSTTNQFTSAVAP